MSRTQSAASTRRTERAPGPVRRLLRLLVIWWTLYREYRALQKFITGSAGPANPGRFVETLITLGPTFIKLGQILSTRPDILPKAYIDALASLQEHAPELPFDTIRDVVERELGGPLEQLFAVFDERPAAAASLAQVHRARLLGGSQVAVKVQRPGLEFAVKRDLDAIGAGVDWLSRLFPKRIKRSNLVELFGEFRRYTLGELDFAHEAKTIHRFRANFRERDDVHFPRVFQSHTTKRVLTLEWAEGMRLEEAASALSTDLRQALVSRVVDVLLKMFVSDGLFHADLHPGNIVFHSDGTFTLLDFGMYGELSGRQRDRFILYWFAVVQRQPRRAFHHFKRQTRILPGADEQAFYARFAELAEEFYASRLRDTSFAKVYLEMMKAGYEHGFVFPSELMLHAKALTTAEALAFVLAPDARFEQLSRPFIAREYVARTASLDLIQRRVSQLLPELLLLGELPPPEAVDDEWDWNATSEVAGQLRERFGDALRRSLERGGLWKSLLEEHARVVLGTTAVASSVDSVLAEIWERYYGLESDLPPENSLGAVFTTHLAAATLAIHQVLHKHGLTTDESYRLIYDIGWRFYTQMGEPPLLLAAAFTRDPHKRLRLATDLFRAFPFGAPGYGWRDVPSSARVVAFDCTRCPVAEFFRKHAASELCVKTWCELDFPLAQKWGGRLERTGTLAQGRDHCDFRWRVEEAGESHAS